jgi:alpha-L-rhamnosidase
MVPQEVFATAFFCHSTDLVARMAGAIGRQEEARKHAELSRQIRAAFNRAFVQSDGRIQGDTQAGYALALHFDLLPEDIRPLAVRRLLEALERYQGRLSTGIQTTHRMMLELVRWGHAEAAWRLLTSREFPSWGFMIDNGATTIWERWDGYVPGRGLQDPGMNSFNHWALGSVGEWLYRHILGLNPDETAPGYEHFTIHPRLGGGLTWARGSYDSIRGRIAADWRVEAGRLRLKVTVPVNSTATVCLPKCQLAEVRESGQPAAQAPGVRASRQQAEAAVFEVGSGDYDFDAPLRER